VEIDRKSADPASEFSDEKHNGTAATFSSLWTLSNSSAAREIVNLAHVVNRIWEMKMGNGHANGTNRPIGG